MQWNKLGLVYHANHNLEWACDSALQPTALLMGDIIRIYAGFRDQHGISRIGVIDLKSDDPLKIVNVSSKPALDVGSQGMFDSHGVVPTAIVHNDGLLYLYYAGYQLPKDVRFIVLGGLAISRDGGETFERAQPTPVMERTPEEPLFRVPHSLLLENGRWRCWYGGGNSFVQGSSKTLPVYDIRYTESPDGVHFEPRIHVCVSTVPPEHRLGRPCVLRSEDGYQMFYGYGTEEAPYQLGYAESKDGLNWVRKDQEAGLALSKSGWDSEMMAYPCVVKVLGRTFLFYNGNKYGKEGFGCAELIKS